VSRNGHEIKSFNKFSTQYSKPKNEKDTIKEEKIQIGGTSRQTHFARMTSVGEMNKLMSNPDKREVLHNLEKISTKDPSFKEFYESLRSERS